VRPRGSSRSNPEDLYYSLNQKPPCPAGRHGSVSRPQLFVGDVIDDGPGKAQHNAFMRFNSVEDFLRTMGY
jgi:hypothetical protein